MKTYDVIISGAGPVGLFLACELALAACSVLILEQAAEPQTPFKLLPFGVRGLSAPSIEALDRRGLLDALDIHKRMKNLFAAGSPRQAGHFAGLGFRHDEIDETQWKYRLPGSPPTHLISEMAELETVLTARALALGVEIRRGVAVTGVAQDADGVRVNGTIPGRWLVGCDGARSVVRKAAGFGFAGTEPEFTGYTIKADIADGAKLRPGRTVTSAGMYFQTQADHILIQDFDGGAFHGAKQPVTLEHAQAVLRRISGTDVQIAALHLATTWTDRAYQATSYREGRILLAGDAAHIHSPLGGQGLNLGLGDAMNLGWKLAATVHGTAPDNLLDSYAAERIPVGAKVLDWSRAQVAIMRPRPESRALYEIFRDLLKTKDGATYFAGRVWGIPAGDRPVAGLSVPNFEFADGTRVNHLMRGGRALLLDFDGDAALRTLAGSYGIKYVGGRPTETLGLTALLVRPDGVVAWAAHAVVDHTELKSELARWFVPHSAHNND
ncbi:FAD-dependent oxidoreductase [Duganella callida]|uniref:FAD-dependent oxidoreductase n=1 Tax=Duganella callida TaxID=2561932 RepID=A0A4Y9SXT3_9BURK|nr:FAD-dependent oxidoreductase [Duganella callida]TFW30169.1 FAD-dependent oxidoreductase [Duganella callida]